MSDFYDIRLISHRIVFTLTSLEVSPKREVILRDCLTVLNTFSSADHMALKQPVVRQLSELLASSGVSMEWVCHGKGEFHCVDVMESLFSDSMECPALHQLIVSLLQNPVRLYEQLKSSERQDWVTKIVSQYLFLQESLITLSLNGGLKQEAIGALSEHFNTLYGRVALRLGALKDCRRALNLMRQSSEGRVA